MPTRCGRRTAAGAAWRTRSRSRRASIFRRHVYGCFFDDPHGLKALDEIGADRVTYESDYPHSDSTWPKTRHIAEEQMKDLDRATIEMIVRGNAITMLGLTPEGRWAR